ncbi:MAG: hypothetical protein ABIK09_07625 [Pseudomonadota bacterium]
MARRFYILGLLVVLSGGCGPGFEGPEKVEDLRVLGVRADPPEIIYLAARPVEATTELSFLVVNPVAPTVPVDWRLTGCVVRDDGRCEAATEILLAEGRDPPGEIIAAVTLPKDLIQASFDADLYFGLFGAAVWIQGVIVQAGEPEARFIKSVLLSPDAGIGRTANTNPWLDEIRTGDEDLEEPLSLDRDGIWRVAAGETIRLLPVSPEETREAYVVPAFTYEGTLDPEAIAGGEIPDFTFTTEALDEELVFHFYTSIGDLSTASKAEGINVILESDQDREDRDLSVNFKAPKEPGAGTLWFVVDDERGGVGWLTIPVVVE